MQAQQLNYFSCGCLLTPVKWLGVAPTQRLSGAFCICRIESVLGVILVKAG